MPQKIVLVDGSSYLFRAYHALPPLTNKNGFATGAMYGVINMLKNLYRGHHPDFFAVVFDDKGKTFRHKLYPNYKANRPPMTPELAEQIKPLHDIIRALGWPLLVYPGVEADDVLGTIAKKASEKNLATVISTGDKDLAQLVDKNISLINTMNNSTLDYKAVGDKFGVTPEQFVDYLTLTGDASDNIPGVEKVGPKTAAKWLNEYQNLENIIKNADKFKGKIGEYLRTAITSTLDLSKKLVTINCDLKLKHQPTDLVVSRPDTELLISLYEKFGFKKWLDEVQTAKKNSEITINTIATKYELILNEKTLNKWLSKLGQTSFFSIDTETTSLKVMTAKLVGISFAVSPGVGAYLPLAHDSPHDKYVEQQLDFHETIEKLRPILTDKKILKVGHNLKYDLSVLNQCGVELNGIGNDTMLMSYVLNPTESRHNLDDLAEKHLNIKTTRFEDIAGKGRNQLKFNQIDIEVAKKYATEDADISLRLYHKLINKIENNKKLYDLYNLIEIRLLRVIARMEQNGVLINSEKLLNLSQNMSEQITNIEQQAFEVAGEKFNMASPKQIQTILFDKLNLPVVRKTPKGQPSTAEDVLVELSVSYELPRLILEHRSLSKLKSTYTDTLPRQINPRTGRIHTSYHQAVTATGRLSSSNPNLQNIPIKNKNGRKIRACFIASPQKLLIAADYSQIELRIMAHLSDDKSLLNAFAKNIDIHTNTAAEVFGVDLEKVTSEQRRHAKAINFGLIYGMSAFGLAKQLNISRSDAAKYIELYFSRYTDVEKYMNSTREFAREHGFVETIFGRRLYLPDINNRNPQRRQYAERTAINAPMQGSAADLIKMAMIEIDRTLQRFHGAMMIMQVHDELVLEVPENLAENIKKNLVEVMENIATLKVPLKVEAAIASNWDNAH